MKASGEKVTNIAIDQIHPFPNHPFQVNDDEAMERLKESISLNGVLTPATVRQLPDGSFQMVSGHRRMAACKALGMEKMPVIVREMDDITATLTMVDSNRQRESLLPSEKANAYKMRQDALKSRSVGQVVPQGGRTTEQIGNETGESYKTVQRFIRLTKLIPPLLQMVDEGKMGMIPAVELSYLPTKEQEAVLSAIESEQSVPSLAQAKALRKSYVEDEFTEDTPISVFSDSKWKPAEKLTLPLEHFAKFFPKDATPKQMEQAIIEGLELRQKRIRSRQQER